MYKIGYVDLSSETVIIKDIPEEMLRRFLGGRGLAAYLLYNHVDKGVNPISPDNVMVVSAGIASGHFATAYGRTHITGKSPLTGHYGDSNIGGDFSPELKYAGFQHLVIKGKAKRPTYLWVHNGQIELKDASHLWGLDTFETQTKICEDLEDPDVKVLCIGPAGERLVRFACVRTRLKRAAGRTGQGCVMGSKQLKAIAVRGTNGVKAQYPDKLIDITRKQYDYARRTKIFQIMTKWGLLWPWVVNRERGFVRSRNHQIIGFPEGLGTMEVDVFVDKFQEKMFACHGCAMHCEHRWKIKEGPHAGLEGEGPEWYIMSGFGAGLANPYWDVALAAEEACNRVGIDVWTFGNNVAWLMELWQRGIIDSSHTYGYNLAWGDRETITTLPDKIANREGLGAIIADGPDEAIKRLRKPEAAHYYYRCGKNLDLEGPLIQQRATPLGNLTSNRGNDHLRGICNMEHMNLPPAVLENIFGRPINPDPLAWDTKAWMATWTQFLYAVADSVGVCKFWTKFAAPDWYGFDEMVEVVNAVTGWDMTKDELMKVGERIWNIERMFNARDGLGREGDLPSPLAAIPIIGGRLDGVSLEPDKYSHMLDEYYDLHGWDWEGRPLPETLEQLGLEKEPSKVL
jgi:aldehyde:ferredoxin oxidoreductase